MGESNRSNFTVLLGQLSFKWHIAVCARQIQGLVSSRLLFISYLPDAHSQLGLISVSIDRRFGVHMITEQAAKC